MKLSEFLKTTPIQKGADGKYFVQHPKGKLPLTKRQAERQKQKQQC